MLFITKRLCYKITLQRNSPFFLAQFWLNLFICSIHGIGHFIRNNLPHDYLLEEGVTLRATRSSNLKVLAFLSEPNTQGSLRSCECIDLIGSAIVSYSLIFSPLPPPSPDSSAMSFVPLVNLQIKLDRAFRFAVWLIPKSFCSADSYQMLCRRQNVRTN